MRLLEGLPNAGPAGRRPKSNARTAAAKTWKARLRPTRKPCLRFRLCWIYAIAAISQKTGSADTCSSSWYLTPGVLMLGALQSRISGWRGFSKLKASPLGLLRLFELQLASVLFQKRAQIGSRIQQPDPLLVIEGHREPTQAVDADAAFFADPKLQVS